MPSLTRTRNACLASAEQDARKTCFVTTSEGSRTIEISESELDFHARQALIDRVRRADVAEAAGTIGITAATLGLIWMLGKCGPALFPAVFQ